MELTFQLAILMGILRRTHGFDADSAGCVRPTNEAVLKDCGVPDHRGNDRSFPDSATFRGPPLTHPFADDWCLIDSCVT